MLPPYFDALIAARRGGQAGRHVHLGYWDDPPDLAAPPLAGEFEAAQLRLTRRAIDLLPLRPRQAVLDVACGFGGTLAAIDDGLRHMQLTGLNIDPRQLELCAGAVSNPTNSLRLVKGDACALPFPPLSFDHLLCVEAMFHFDSRKTFLAEAVRCLRPGGTLVLTDILLRQPGDAAVWDGATIASIIRRDYGPWPDLWVEPADLQGWARAAGLAVVGREDWSAATLPSYRVIAPDRLPEAQRHPSGGAVFRWLHVNGWLTYQAMSFRKL